MNKRRLALVFIFLLSGCSSTQKGASTNCTIVRIASLPATVTPTHQILIPVGIKGSTVMFQLDTGAGQSVMLESAALRLGLRPATFGARMNGVNGSTELYRVNVDHFSLGENIHPDASFPMAVVQMRQGLKENEADGLLGSDYLKNFDLELDLQNKTINLFAHHPCPGQAAYWPHDVLLETDFSLTPDNHIYVPVAINGREGEAIFDTGAGRTSMTWGYARHFGITRETAGIKAVGALHGIGDRAAQASGYIIPALTLGDETIQNVPILLFPVIRTDRVGESTKDVVLLGEDFDAGNRVYIAYDERKIYFTPYRYRVAPEQPPPESQ